MSNFGAARSALEANPNWDIVLVSHRFDDDEAVSFIEWGREAARDCAYILVMRAGDSSSDRIASTIAQGIDGFLFEPFSPDGMRETAEIAVAVKIHSGKQRVKMAITVLLPTIIREIEQRRKNPDSDGNQTEFENVKATCRMMKDIAEHADTTYEAIINEIFDDVEGSTGSAYSGSSDRIRRAPTARRRTS